MECVVEGEASTEPADAALNGHDDVNKVSVVGLLIGKCFVRGTREGDMFFGLPSLFPMSNCTLIGPFLWTFTVFGISLLYFSRNLSLQCNKHFVAPTIWYKATPVNLQGISVLPLCWGGGGW